MDTLTRQLVSALDRQRDLRRGGDRFDERARLQSEINDLRARLRVPSTRSVHRAPFGGTPL